MADTPLQNTPNSSEPNQTDQNQTDQNQTDQNQTDQNQADQNQTDQNQTDQNQTDQDQTEVVTLPEYLSEQQRAFITNLKLTADQQKQVVKAFEDAHTEQLRVVQTLQQQGQQVIESWGEKKDENLALTKQVFEKFDPDNKIGKLLTETGFVHHPDVINFFLTIGEAFKEGGFISASPRPSQKHAKKSLAEILYGETTNK